MDEKLAIYGRELEEAMRRAGIPGHMHGAIKHWVLYGVAGGSFLTYVLQNKLVEACGRADDININHIKNYADLLYNDLPMECWGSLEKAESWAEQGGLNGRWNQGETVI